MKSGIVIGNNYVNSDRNKLKFSVIDAIKMKEILENKDIGDFNNIVQLINKSSKDAQTEIEKLFKNVHQGDVIFIYYSGHGKKTAPGELFLLFDDQNEEFPLATSLPFDFIHKCRNYYLQTKKASLIIVLDCCYSAEAGIKGTEDIQKIFTNFDSESNSKGMVILSSTGFSGDQLAREDDNLKHSVFTYYLIEGLEKGSADRNGDGYISINDLYDYAYEEMKKRENVQLPLATNHVEGLTIIGKNPQKIRENEYKLRLQKLFDEFSDKFPTHVLHECQAVLRKYYKNYYLFEKNCNSRDRILFNYLEFLLNSDHPPEIRDEYIQNCIEAVQLQKNSTNTSHSKQIEAENYSKNEIEEFHRQREEEKINNKGINTFNIKQQKEEKRDIESEEQYKLAIKADSNDAYAHYNYGDFLKKQGRPDEAEEQYKLAIKLDPNAEYAHFTYGYLLEKMGRKKEAEEQYKLAIKADPNYEYAYTFYGNLLKEMGRKKEAEEQYKLAIKAKPNYEYAYSSYGNFLKEMGRKKEAEEQYKLAIKADPNSEYAHSHYGDLLKEMGRKKEAEEQYKLAIKAKPNYEYAHSHYGDLLKEMGRKKEAEEQYKLAENRPE